jgi:hypothetical protein
MIQVVAARNIAIVWKMEKSENVKKSVTFHSFPIKGEINYSFVSK